MCVSAYDDKGNLSQGMLSWTLRRRLCSCSGWNLVVPKSARKLVVDDEPQYAASGRPWLEDLVTVEIKSTGDHLIIILGTGLGHSHCRLSGLLPHLSG